MRHIPNILSFFRIALIPFFVWQWLAGNTLAAAVILGISGITDLLDGFLARRFGWISQLGKVLDPIADKLTQVTVCVALAVRLRRFWPLFVVLLLKELLMLAAGGYLLKKGIKLEGAKIFGKVATTLFYVSMVAIVLFPGLPEGAVLALLLLTAGCSVVSILLYVPEFFRYNRLGGGDQSGAQ